MYGFWKHVPASVFDTDKKLDGTDHHSPLRQNFGVIPIFFRFVFDVVLFPSIFQAGGFVPDIGHFNCFVMYFFGMVDNTV